MNDKIEAIKQKIQKHKTAITIAAAAAGSALITAYFMNERTKSELEKKDNQWVKFELLRSQAEEMMTDPNTIWTSVDAKPYAAIRIIPD